MSITYTTSRRYSRQKEYLENLFHIFNRVRILELYLPKCNNEIINILPLINVNDIYCLRINYENRDVNMQLSQQDMLLNTSLEEFRLNGKLLFSDLCKYNKSLKPPPLFII